MEPEKLRELIEVALGQKRPTLLVKNAKIVNTYTMEIEEGDVAIWGDLIAGIGYYNEGEETIDAQGLYAAPSFIDSHIHIESTHLPPGEFARTVVPRGTGAVVADPHEMANVLGLEGIKFMIDNSEDLPLDIFYMIPSCVPASKFESSGAELGPQQIKQALRWEGVLGLGEMMDYPGLLAKETVVLQKLAAAQGRPIDGHAPFLGGRELNAYLAAGPSTDHETTEAEIALEKVHRGMTIQIRQGSSERNLKELVPLLNERTFHRFMFASDDRSPLDLVQEGHMDHILREAVATGLDPLLAIRLATLNPAEHYGLRGRGAVAPGKRANLVLLKDLQDFQPQLVLYRGQAVAEDGRPKFSTELIEDERARCTVRIKLQLEDLKVPPEGADQPVIKLVPGQIVTEWSTARPKVRGNQAVPDLQGDVLKLVVVERHRASGRVGRGFVQGFGLKGGALASSVAHDAHNIVAVGASDGDIFKAIQRIEELGGGMIAVRAGQILAELPLPLAGLLSDLSAERTVKALAGLQSATEELGSRLKDPFAPLSFLALSVIPKLRLTDRGLLDVERFRLVD